MKMVNLKVAETSGVDHPAHLHEGWLVMKSAAEVLDDVLSPSEEHAVSEQNGTTVEKTVEERLAEAEALVETLTAENEALKSAPATEEPVEEQSIEEVAKSLPEPMRKAVEESLAKAAAAQARADVAEETLRKEREMAADADSIAMVKSLSNLTLDAEKVGPALRSLAETDADLAKAVTDTLTAANAQAESADIFKEMGRTSGLAEGSAEERLNVIAKSISDETGETFAVAFTKAVEGNPDLYKQHLSEKG
jgi:hypothetical protein